ncbi:hypothetical protein KSZ_32630 [Dictyobacter formicarum]|uniref:Uncharacterized protein n=1 Tax=Dictyobacter formicarum TaxID=2778368 RepID=A0ABQ3VGF2_9CHLR|nr:hypothetical protein KSZ_32630 [Dictyobacter formicarum]
MILLSIYHQEDGKTDNTQRCSAEIRNQAATHQKSTGVKPGRASGKTGYASHLYWDD